MLRALIRNLTIAIGALAVTASDAASRQTAAPVVELGKVKNFRGRVVTVCGRVVTYDCDTEQRQTRLDFEKPYWANPPVVLIDRAARSAFGRRLEDTYVQANLCATGMVERVKGRDLVRVQTPDQIAGCGNAAVVRAGPRADRGRLITDADETTISNLASRVERVGLA